MRTNVVDLWYCLEQSIILQAHYARLLNDYDGGERIIFKDAKDWIERLKQVNPQVFIHTKE